MALSLASCAMGASLFSSASEVRYRLRTWCCCEMPVMGTSLSCVCQRAATEDGEAMAYLELSDGEVRVEPALRVSVW